jgi:Coenzyme PQQ synthesis protein D (PqqD)
VETYHQLRPNELGIAAKVIDGEAIIIRLSDGMYFSLNSSGSIVWELIEQGRPLREIHSALAGRYDAIEQEIREDLTRLAMELLQENLVVQVSDSAAAPGELPTIEGKQTYESPRLYKYQDMVDLLALDPPAPGLAYLAWKDPAKQ